MRRALKVLLVVLAVAAMQPAASAVGAKTSITVTTDRGRQCVVYVEGYIQSGNFKTNGVTSCGADRVHGEAMERLTAQLATSGTFLLGAQNGPWQASCQLANYCEAWGQRSGTLPGMSYTVSGDFTLDAADYPWDRSEQWVSWPSECRSGASNRLFCTLSASATHPLPL